MPAATAAATATGGQPRNTVRRDWFCVSCFCVLCFVFVAVCRVCGVRSFFKILNFVCCWLFVTVRRSIAIARSWCATGSRQCASIAVADDSRARRSQPRAARSAPAVAFDDANAVRISANHSSAQQRCSRGRTAATVGCCCTSGAGAQRQHRPRERRRDCVAARAATIANQQRLIVCDAAAATDVATATRSSAH